MRKTCVIYLILYIFAVGYKKFHKLTENIDIPSTKYYY